MFMKKLTDEGSSETSMHVTLRRIFQANLSEVSIFDVLSSLDAEEPIAYGIQKTFRSHWGMQGLNFHLSEGNAC